jgi:CheY-like chemotaxis protein
MPPRPRTYSGTPEECAYGYPYRLAQSPVVPTLARPGACDDRGVAISVLVVDDDPTSVSLAARVLEEMGAELITTAADAGSAIAAANETRPDAALVDVGLPDRDGIDLAYELAALPWRPRVVLMSTDRDAGSAIAGEHDGDALAFVPKEELAAGRLRSLLASD